MTDTITRAAGPASAGADSAGTDPASRRDPEPVQRLRQSMAAARVSFPWFGTRRSLSREQKQEAADAFSAEGRYLSAGKKLLATSHPAFGGG